MGFALPLLLVTTCGLPPAQDPSREVRLALAVVLLDAADSASLLPEAPEPQPLTVCDVRFYHDAFAAVLTMAPPAPTSARITYSTALPIFRDMA